MAILCIDSNGDCKGLKNVFVKAAKSNKGVVDFVAADCIQQPNLCRIVEPDVQRYPCVVYFGYGKRVSYVYGDDKMSARSLRVWLADLVPDRLVNIKSGADQDKFFDVRPGRARLVYMTEKVAVPPKLKALSMEFEGRVDIAILSKKDTPDIFARIEEANSIVVTDFPALFNVQSRSLVNIPGSEFHRYLTSLAEDAQSVKLQEFTVDLHESGVCNRDDHQFCLLVLFQSAADLELEKKRGTLRSICEEYNEHTDALRVLYVIRDSTPATQPRLWTMLQQLTPDWDDLAGSAIFWRPSWRRFDTFRGEVSDAEALRSFVRSTFVRAALDGDRGLRVEHHEL